MTRWSFDNNLENVWRSHAPADVLRVITRRFADANNAGILSVLLDVASTLDRAGEPFVREAWLSYPERVELPSLAMASSRCLEHREGFDRVTKALSGCEGHKKRDQMYVLSYFQSPETLDWIEQNAFSPIMEDWGRLAAASEFNWPHARKWLESGRPLNLIALDALAEIIRPQSPLLQKLSPRLHQPPDFETFGGVLAANVQRDSVPRVKMATEFILKNVAASKSLD